MIFVGIIWLRSNVNWSFFVLFCFTLFKMDNMKHDGIECILE